MADIPGRSEQTAMDSIMLHTETPHIHTDSGDIQTGTDGHHEYIMDDVTDESSTTTLASNAMDYEYENGRRYHAAQFGDYFMPNDEAAQDNMFEIHDISYIALGNRNFTAPVNQPLNILDIGTGTGTWALRVADNFPGARVIGIDISPIQLEFVPNNLRFQLFDCERDWNFSQKFDLIHIRYMSGAIGDWPALIRKCWDSLKSGGWLECTELEGWAHTNPEGWADSGLQSSLTRNSASFRWQINLEEAASSAGKRLNIASELDLIAIDTGFRNVVKNEYPDGQNEEQRELTNSFRRYISSELAAWSLRLYTRQLGWSKHEVETLLTNVRNDIENPENNVYCLLHNTIAQKP